MYTNTERIQIFITQYTNKKPKELTLVNLLPFV